VRLMRRRATRRLAYKALKLFGVEIPPTVRVGDGFHLAHGGVGVVLSQGTIIGSNVKIFQGVTLGFADEYLPLEHLPEHLLTVERIGRVVVEDDVVVGAGAKVLFKYGQTLVLGRGAVIGANAVVLSSVPPGEIWAGIPACRVGVNGFARLKDASDHGGAVADPDHSEERARDLLTSVLHLEP